MSERHPPGPDDLARVERNAVRRLRRGVTAVLSVLLVGAVLVIGRGDPPGDATVIAASTAGPDASASEGPGPDVEHQVLTLADLTAQQDPTMSTDPGPDAPSDVTPDDDGPPAPQQRTFGVDDEPSTLTVPIDEPVQMIGMSWIGSPGAEIGWRFRTGEAWTDWARAEDSPEEAPDNSPRSGVGPIHLATEGAAEIEIDLGDGPLEDLQVHLFRWDVEGADRSDDDLQPAGMGTADHGLRPAAVTPADGALRPAAATSSRAGVAPRPAIRARSTWLPGGWATGNDDCKSGPIPVKKVEHAVVHHSATSNAYTAAEVPAIMRSIQTFHTTGRGWCDIAYNYAVDRFGTIWEGRINNGVDVVGGHAIGFNSTSVGVVVLGQHQPGASPLVAQPTNASLKSAEAVLAWRLSANDIDPTARVQVTSRHSGSRWPEGTVVTLPAISGHRDVGLTACPGDHLHTKLPSIRTGAKGRIPIAPPTTTTPPTTRPGQGTGWWAPFGDAASFTDRQARDFLGRAGDAVDTAEVQREFERTGTPAAAILWFAARPAVTDSADPAVRMHLAWLDRPPTAAEYTTRRDALRRGTAPATVARSLLADHGSGGLTDTAFVERIHRNVTGKPIDSATRNRLLGRLGSGTPRETILLDYLADPGFVSRTQSAVRVIVIHHAMLTTMPSTADLDRWTASGPAALAADILTSAPYRNRIGGTP